MGGYWNMGGYWKRHLLRPTRFLMYSKINKIKEIFIVTAHFYLKLVQKFREKKSPPFGGPL